MVNGVLVIAALLALIFFIFLTHSKKKTRKIRELARVYKESASEEIQIIKKLLPTYRNSFSKGYGSSGLLVCVYADVVAKATIENLNSRSESELPSSPEEIKQAIIEIAESIFLEAADNAPLDFLEKGSPLDLLKMAYSSLASFLPESKAQLVTERNRAWLSENLNHPGLRRFQKAVQLDAEVQVEETRLSNEFSAIIVDKEEKRLEYLRNKRVELLRQKNRALL